MGVKIRHSGSVWDKVPDAHVLQEKLAFAKDPKNPEWDRIAATSYLNGACKAMAHLPERQQLRDYLRAQIRAVRASIYHGSSNG